MRVTVASTTLCFALLTACGGSGTPTNTDLSTDLASCCPGCLCLPDAFGYRSTYAINHIDFPNTPLDFAIDLNGDGIPDNRLSNIIGALAAQNVGIGDVANNAVQSGDLILLLALASNDAALLRDPAAEVDLFHGEALPRTAQIDSSAPNPDGGPVSTAPDFSGNGHFQIDRMPAPARLAGTLEGGHYDSRDPVTTRAPSSFVLSLPFLADMPPLLFALNGVHVQFNAYRSGLTVGALQGSVRHDDLVRGVVPTLAAVE